MSNNGILDEIPKLPEIEDKDAKYVIEQLKSGMDCDINFDYNNDEEKKSAFKTLINVLQSPHLPKVNGKKYLVLRFNYGGDFENMRMINNQSISHIIHLIEVLEGKRSDTAEDFSDSDQAILFGLMDLNYVTFEWYEYERAKKSGGYFPYYNKNEQLDLSKFGIYQKKQITNDTYIDNCFITAVKNSNLFSIEEINYMRSLINTRYLPSDELKYIAETFNCCISIAYFNEVRGKINKANVYGNEKSERKLKLLLRCGHYMLYDNSLIPENKYVDEKHKNLNTLITRMLNCGDFELIDDISNCEKFIAHEFEFQNLEYSPNSVRLIKNFNDEIENYNLLTYAVFTENKFQIILNRKAQTIELKDLFDALEDKTLIYMPELKDLVNEIPINDELYKITPIRYRKTIQQIKLTARKFKKTIVIRNIRSLTSIDFSSMNIREFAKSVNNIMKTIREKLHVDIMNYSTLPKLAIASAIQFGVFDGIYEVSGVVQSFAKKCVHGGIIKTLFDGCFSIKNVTCFDINSSYGTSMNQMQGIPIGKPKVFYNEIPNDSCYSLIQCKISNIRNDKLGKFTFINDGINFIDSILLEEIHKYIDCDIEIINGYYWNEGFNNRINEFSQLLYNLRSIEGLNKFGKNLLSSLYGKSLQSNVIYKNVIVQKSEIGKYIAENGNFIYEIINKKNHYEVKIIKCINISYSIPTFGIMVLSESRKRLNNIINYCNENSINIYSIKTDSFVIDDENVDKFTEVFPIGDKLGELKIEYSAKYIKFTSNTTYKAILKDGKIRMRGVVN